MSLHLRITTAVICAAVCIAPSDASPQALPHVYTLVDVGPVPEIACPCIATPFAVPAYRPGYGYGDGAAIPETDAPPSADLVKRYAAEPALIARDVKEGRAGDRDASLAVGMHLAEQSVIAGADQKVEEQAARWLHLAARQGNIDASMFLASRYIRGKGIKQNDAAGAFWFHQAAVVGNNVAMVALGLLYATGRGVPQDSTAAIHWWEQAQRTTPLASRFLGDAYAPQVARTLPRRRQQMRAESTSGDGGVKRDHLKFGIHHAVREQRAGLAAAESDEPWEIIRLMHDVARHDRLQPSFPDLPAGVRRYLER